MQKRVLVVDSIVDLLETRLEEDGFSVDTFPENISPKDLKKRMVGCYGIAVRSKPEVTEEVLRAGSPTLQIVGRAGVGLKNVDLETAKRMGIAVYNTPGSNSVAVAELVFGLMLEDARKIGSYDRGTHAGEFPRGKLGGRKELCGATIGLLGLGNVGALVARRAEAFSMCVLYHDPFVTSERYENATVERIFARAHYVSLHQPLNNFTANSITEEHICSLPEGGMVINTARYGLFAPGAVEAALDQRPDITMALDVHRTESPGEHPLARYGGRIILTPHQGASTHASEERSAQVLANRFIAYAKSEQTKQTELLARVG